MKNLRCLKNWLTCAIATFFFLGAYNCAKYYSMEHNKHFLLQRFIVIFTITLLLLLWDYWVYIQREERGKAVWELLLEARYIVCGSFLLLFSILGIHGFSLEIWNYYLPFSGQWKTQLWGTENPIQSDVWAIGIPQLLNQIHNGFPMFNYDMMTQGANVTLSGMPGMGLTFLGQPHFWGALFGARFGLAWLYWFRKFALLLGCYETLLFVTDQKKELAFVGALTITTSPVLNWWFGHTVTTTVIYAFWCVACVVNYLRHRENRKKKIGCAILGGIGAIGFVFGWYPALQVPFGYLILILSVAALIRYKRRNGVLFEKEDVLILAVTFLLVAVILGQYLWVSKDSIHQLTSTAYPGKRVCLGGEYSKSYLGYYAFQHLLGISSTSFGNYCEVSSVVPFLPMIYLAVPIVLIRSIKNKTIKDQGLLIALFLYELFLTTWMFIPYPEWFAKASFFSFVAGNRIIWSVGVVSAIIGIICLKEFVEYSANESRKVTVAIITSIIATAIIALATFKYRDDFFISINGTTSVKKQCIIVFALFFLFYTLYVWGKKKAVLLMLVFVSLYFEKSISPIEMGVGSLTNSELAKEIQLIESENPNSTWVVEGAFVNANFVYAQGVDVYNTTNQYMDLEKWKMFEEKGYDENIYNRYSQLMVSLTFDETSLQLLQNDLISMGLNLEDCEELGIDYVMTSNALEETLWKEIVTLQYVDNMSGQRIYKINSK